MAGSAVRRHRIAALAAWESDFRELARGGRRRLRRHRRRRYTAARRLGRGAARRPSSARCRSSAGAATRWPDRIATICSGRAAAAPLAAEASAGEIARTVALASSRSGRLSAKASGEPPLFGADDFDAGLSEASVEEFFEALPPKAAVLLTTAAPLGALVAPGGGRARSAGRRGRRRGAARPARRRARDRESDEHRLHHRLHQAAQGPGGRAQAPRHVHRGHRRPLGPAPHGLRARRQLDRRGPGRLRRPRVASRSTPTTP